jgi:histidinol-phosphatase (PHP family)
MLLDYHVHPDYSIDARGTIQEYCRTALEIGINEICFTTHYDILPNRREIDGYVRRQGDYIPTTDNWLPEYLSEIEAVRITYAGQGLTVKAGLEVDYHPVVEDQLRAILAAHEFDYVLGAVHCLDRYSIAIESDCALYYRGKSALQVCEAYYSLLAAAVDSNLFDTIAHLDLYKKFAAPYLGPAIDRTHTGLLEPILAAMAARGTGIEINTKNWYKGLPEPSPSRDLLQLCREQGITVVTIGSDCHRPEDLGKGVSRAMDLARSLGFASITKFTRRQAEPAILFSAE